MRYTKQIQPLRTGNRTSAVYHLQEGTQEHPLQVKVDWIAAGNGDTVTGVIEGRMFDTDEWVDLAVFTEGDFGAKAEAISISPYEVLWLEPIVLLRTLTE